MAEKKSTKNAEDARIPGDVVETAPGGTAIEDAGSAWKRVDRTQGEYDDSGLQKSLEDLGRSEAQRVEDEKPA